MRQFHGLERFRQPHHGVVTPQNLANRMLDALHDCQCHIYGRIGDNDKILLATLLLLPDALHYDAFDRRIDLIVAGPILRNDCVPLTYRFQGKDFAVSGRCSTIPRVCGVDWYLHAGYTGGIGDLTRQKFSIAIDPLLDHLFVR